MRQIIYCLPDQISETINLVPKFHSKKMKFDRVLICGMGGSGISGEILAATYPQLEIISNKDYTIPGYINKSTLSILISYSGNTEETLNNYKILSQRKTEMVVISSAGGLLKKKADLKIKIPEGLPPRGALGYLFTPLPFILYQYRLIKTNPEKDLSALAKFLKRKRNGIEKKAENLAARFVNKLPIIYANSNVFLPVAKRWCTQLNENAKTLGHVNVIPEMNHNEIVGLGRPEALNKKLLLIYLNDPKAPPRSKIRIKIMNEIIKDKIANIIEVDPHGKTNLQRQFWTIMLGDFVSYYLAVKTGIDPMPVKRIDYLKKRLSEFR